MDSYNEKIKKQRIQKNISQVEMAKAAGLSRGAYLAFENSNDSKNLTLKSAKGIAKALGVSFNELFEIDFYGNDWQTKTQENIDQLWNSLKEKNKLIEQKDLLIEMLQKEKDRFKMSVIQSIANFWDLRLMEIENQINNTDSEKEKELLLISKNQALRNKDFMINNFISVGFLSQEDIDNYYSLLRQEYESLIKNQVR